MIHCKDGSIYTGISSWIELRFMQHEAGTFPDCYTVRRRPLKLVYAEAFDNPKLAIEWKKRIKKWSRKKKWALIEEKWDRLKELSVCKNYTHYKNYHDSNLNPIAKSSVVSVASSVVPVTSSVVLVTSSVVLVTSSVVEKSTADETRSDNNAA